MIDKKRESAVIYRSFYEAMDGLDKEVQADLWKAICELSFNRNEVELTGIARNIFKLMKPQIEANIKKYENGLKPKDKQKISKVEANDNDNEECIMIMYNDNEKIDKKSTNKKNENYDFCFDDFTEQEKESIQSWLTYKKEKRHSYTKTGLLSLRKKLLRDKNNKIDISESIEHSIANNYSGIYVNSSFNNSLTIQNPKRRNGVREAYIDSISGYLCGWFWDHSTDNDYIGAYFPNRTTVESINEFLMKQGSDLRYDDLLRHDSNEYSKGKGEYIRIPRGDN